MFAKFNGLGIFRSNLTNSGQHGHFMTAVYFSSLKIQLAELHSVGCANTVDFLVYLFPKALFVDKFTSDN
jgi:hypothetical protein